LSILADLVRAEGTGFIGDRQFAEVLAPGGRALHTDEVNLFHFTACELRLQQGSEVLGARADDNPCGVRIQSMRGARMLRRIDFMQEVLQRVPIESATGMHRKWRRLVQNDERFVLMQDADVSADLWLLRLRQHMQIPIS